MFQVTAALWECQSVAEMNQLNRHPSLFVLQLGVILMLASAAEGRHCQLS